MIEMKSAGTLKKVRGMVFEYEGHIFGKKVVGYVDTVDGGRIVLREITNGTDELNSLIEKNNTIGETKPPKSQIPIATPVVVPFDFPKKKTDDKQTSLF